MPGRFTPKPPHWRVDWDAIDAEFDCIRALADCPQDPIYHAEGNVWIHTRMVCEALAAAPGWRALEEPARDIVFWAAILHDIGKPARTKEEAHGRISSRGHSKTGEIMARALLWRAGLPFAMRETICGMITYHQVPFFLLQRDDPTRLAAEISYATRADLLVHLARADIEGRTCDDKDELFDRIDLFGEYCDEKACLSGPFPFASDHSRFEYFRRKGRAPDYEAYDDRICDVTVMSGLPASGKDYWIAAQGGHNEVVSLDDIRRALRIDAGEDQGKVVTEAREQARKHLRAGRDFTWNATNVSRQLRTKAVGLCADYKARVHIVYVEAPHNVVHTRNRARERPVPDKAMTRMLEKWEVPSRTEAHDVKWVTADD